MYADQLASRAARHRSKPSRELRVLEVCLESQWPVIMVFQLIMDYFLDR